MAVSWPPTSVRVARTRPWPSSTWLTSKVGAKQVLFPLPRYRKADILLLRGLLEDGSYRAVIDRRYRLEDVVEATRYVETEQKLGNVVLRVTGED